MERSSSSSSSSSSSNDPPSLGGDLNLGCGTSESNTPTGTPSASASSSASKPSTSSPNTPSGGSTSAPAAPMMLLAQGSSSTSRNSTIILLHISTTTGGNFTVQVDNSNTVLALKKIVAKKLKVAKDRICLLHRERELQDGTLLENGLINESKIILIPNVETGLLAQRPENTVMQALESLNDTQVNDFLSGKTPLNLSMRLGDHMMLIQLQLSTVTPNSGSTRSSRSSSMKSRTPQVAGPSGGGSKSTSTTSTPLSMFSSNADQFESRIFPTSSSSSSSAASTSQQSISSRASRSRTTSVDMDNNSFSTSAENHTTTTLPTTPPNHNHSQQPITLDEYIEYIETPPASLHSSTASATTTDCSPSVSFTDDQTMLEQSPIKSLSNLVSSPIKTTPLESYPTTPDSPESPIILHPDTSISINDTAKFTSCICKRLNAITPCDHASTSSTPSTRPSSSSSSSTPNHHRTLHRTTNNPISARKRNWTTSNNGPTNNAMFMRRTKSSDNLVRSITQQVTTPQAPEPSTTTTVIPNPPGTLAEASRSLTQTLRKLSKEVFTNNKTDLTHSATIHHHRPSSQSSSLQRKATSTTSASSSSSSSSSSSGGGGSGAVIESMKNHGKGIYSGTFSGTLNPALQDRNGRPKRDISTVIHILNDLLSATPHYTRGARICFEPTTTSASTPTTVSRSIKQSNRHSLPATTTSRSSNCSKCNAVLTAVKPQSSPRCPTNDCSGDSPPATLTTTSDATPPPPSQRCRCSRALQFDDDESMSPATDPTPSGCHCPPAGQSLLEDTTIDEATSTAHICTKCRTVERENSKTKSKLDQLRLVMQQKKERREARKLQTAPYTPVPPGTAAARLLAAAATSSSSSAAAALNAQTATPATATLDSASATTTTTDSDANSAGNTIAANNGIIAEVATINSVVEEVDTAA